MSWYKCFYKIGLHESETLLLEFGGDGSFLVRPSSSIQDQNSLTVRHGNQISHFRIVWNGDSYELDSVGVRFATIDDLIEHYLGNQISREGIFLRSPLCMNSQPPSSELWYHGNILGEQAEELFVGQPNSSFLVRESRTSLGNYVLTVKSNEKIKHIKIFADGNPKKYQLDYQSESDQEEFLCLEDLVRHFRTGLVDANDEYICTKHPINRSSVPANELERWLIRNQERDGLETEWNELTQDEINMKIIGEEITVARQPENMAKNRYTNILPYDNFRVILEKPYERTSRFEPTDYINASKVSHFDKEIGEKKGKSYISTQGPLPNTVEDFWFMVMQEKSSAILMIANEVEKERKKCEKYWPDKVNETKTWGKAKVTLLSENKPAPAFLERLLRVEVDGETHHVVQFQFILWPDFSTPDDEHIEQVLQYLARVNKITRDRNYNGVPVNSKAPIIVHCSAGIGRSGALIVIDMISDQLEFYQGDITIDIKKTVAHCRKHRHGMVQTIEQYKFIAKTIARKSKEFTRR